jgi:hypothetical protein
MAAIEALGPVRWIIVPSGYHRIDAPAFAARYPDAKVMTPAGATQRVAKKVRVDGTLDLLPADPQLAWQPLAGVPSEVALVHTDGKRSTLIFNDAFMNLPAKLPGFKGFIVKLIGSTGGPKVSRTAKYFIVKDRPAYADHLRRLAELPGLSRVIMAHGAILDEAVPETVVAAANRLAQPAAS